MKMFVKRMYAGMIDALLVALTVGAIYHIFIGQSAMDESFRISYRELDFNITTITIGILFIYYAVCEILGQSIGKKIFNLKIKYQGKGIIARILRPFIKIVVIYIWFIGFPMAILGALMPEKKLIYDFLFKTEIGEINEQISGGSLR